jgi:uncharacterized membrane protein YkvA (DUF1232 family)
VPTFLVERHPSCHPPNLPTREGVASPSGRREFVEDMSMWKRLSMLWLLVRGDAKRLWYALKHPDAPGWLKLGTVGVVLYLISPIDLIPDVVPLLGVVDDLVLVPAAIRWMLKRLPAHVRDHADRRARGEPEAVVIDEVR